MLECIEKEIIIRSVVLGAMCIQLVCQLDATLHGLEWDMRRGVGDQG